LNTRVRELEGELQRLSEEVSTDALTQVANRRGLAQAFDVESARSQREGSPLAIGLIDIDNFKKLNDSLGHGAGDVALKALATQVRTALRPVDHVARFGGEEFVVLLPGTAVTDAQEALTRVQRSLSMGLFMHEGREVFVTFSAGVTVWRAGEPLGSSLERADSALYEAKRTGKNRTCAA
jgi:diguanylate cyclase